MEISTNFLAVWGAIVSTVAVLWNMLIALNDRGKIKISVRLCFISKEKLRKEDPILARALFSGNETSAGLVPRTFIDLYNTGKTAITVLRLNVRFEDNTVEKIAGYYFRSKEKVISPLTDFPATIAANGYMTLHFSDEFIDEKFLGLEVLTSSGKTYKQKKKEIVKLRDQAIWRNMPEEEREIKYAKKLLRKSKVFKIFRL